jgi:hypothetical protein
MDVYLEPLINDLLDMYDKGVEPMMLQRVNGSCLQHEDQAWGPVLVDAILFWTDLRPFVYVMWICVATSHVCVVTSLTYGCVDRDEFCLYLATSSVLYVALKPNIWSYELLELNSVTRELLMSLISTKIIYVHLCVFVLTVYFGAPSMFITLWFGFDYGTNPPLGTLII